VTVRAVVIADTHIRRNSKRRLPEGLYDEFERADLILHAGDIVIDDVLTELAKFAPTYAVLGNNDAEVVGALPERRVIDVGGLAVAMVHEPGASAGRAERLHRWFPDADVVVFGHTHMPLDGPGVDGQWLLNPGSPIERRRAPHHTYAVLEVENGELVNHEIRALG